MLGSLSINMRYIILDWCMATHTHTQVTHKTQSLDMGRYEAIFEVYTDMLVERSGDCSAALFCTLTQDFKEFPASFMLLL